MKIYNARNVIIGIAVFLLFFSFPFWSNIFKTAASSNHSLDTPTINELTEKKCIEDIEYMRANHMQLLKDWKVSVVRDENRIYVAKDGTEYNMSLQNTCMECHSNKTQFCDECHDFSGVETPSCWDCHVEPKEEN
jgi:hypothetical protein